MLKRIICVIFCFIIIVSLTVTGVGAYTPTDFEIDAEGALLVSIDTGDVLFSKNPDKKLYPASLTKLMTALLLYENVDDLDSETMTVSENALKLLEGTDSSVGGLKEGEVLTARQMLYVLLLSSANDGSNVIAEHIGGSIDNFVVMMNQRAAELGMVNTNYANAHGLHDYNHYTTVNDMYLLTKYFLSIDVLKEVSYTTKYKLAATNKSGERNYTTTNFLLINNSQRCTAEKYKNEFYYYKYAKGVKTGYTDPAGRCLISTASKNGYNYMCILMNSPVYDEKGRKIRIEFGDTKALYEWAFENFEYKTVLQGEGIIAEARVELAWDTDYVSVSPSGDFSAIVPKVADSSTISTNIHWYKEAYDAPIKKGDVLGECEIVYAGETLGTVTLVASKDVSRSTIMYVMRSTKRVFNAIVSSPVFLIIIAILVLAIVIFIIVCVVINSPRRRKRRY